MAKNYRSEVDAAIAELGDISKYGVDMVTTQGPIRLEFFADAAPGHVKNFLGLTKMGFYDGLGSHRLIPSFMVQLGCPDGNGTGGPGYQIDAEFNDRPHETGVLSMARSQSPNSAGSQFFICLTRVPHLDNQYTVFGKCRDDESLETIAKMEAVPTGPGDQPKEPIVIETATVVEL